MSGTLFLAGGGTGGHVYPLIAVADALKAAAPELDLVFIGTEKGLETKVVPERGYALELVEVVPIRGNGLRGALAGIGRAAQSLPRARQLVRRHAALGVVSIGGYAAGPVSLAARTLGRPVMLIEPNSVIGLANRLIAPLVQRAYTAFEESEKHFRPGVVRRIGVPIRKGFEPVAYARKGRGLQVLVLGGSQGAKALNEALPAALAMAKTPVKVVHQCGRAHEAAVRERYASLGGGDRVQVVPFIEDVPAAIAKADVVVGRSGASAVAEICAVGRPSLLVPYPYAAGDHQRVNAQSLERAGAAICISAEEASADRLARELDALAQEPKKLEQMASAARRLGRPEAATQIARDILQVLSLAEYAEFEAEQATTEEEPGTSNEGPSTGGRS